MSREFSTTEFTIEGLDIGERYKLRVKAFKLVDGKQYITVKVKIRLSKAPVGP